jgi:muramidase (phage lysozyme)
MGPQYAGLVSTAAGAFQIKLSTWLACKKACALPGFSDTSQQAAALYLIQGRGSLDALKAGWFDDFIAACAPASGESLGASVSGLGGEIRSVRARRMAFTRDAWSAFRARTFYLT